MNDLPKPKSCSIAKIDKDSTKGIKRIAALRVEFKEDNDGFTTSNGNMNLFVDPVHNKEYFEDELANLRDYFYQCSRGQLELDYTVFPDSSNESYLLSETITYYGAEDNWEKRITQLLNDAIEIAKADTNLNLGEYDYIIILYAGAPDATDLRYDSRDDITSSFISSDNLATYMNLPNGIIINDSVNIYNGTLLPEYSYQDGFSMGNLGIWARVFAHQLGLPDLYDTETGTPRIGRWGLMDFGQFNGNGYFPAEPCAWSKVYLDWVEPKVFNTNQDTIIISSVENGGDIIKIPIGTGEDEYFLIENRQRNPSGSGFPTSNEYDWGLPGDGILIWHINERIIRESLLENKINVDIYHQGVNLIEADGVNDIEYFSGAMMNNPEDAFYYPNNDNFTSSSFPNSNSVSGTYTGISITNITQLDTIMTFSLVFDNNYYNGYPSFIGYRISPPNYLPDGRLVIASTIDSTINLLRVLAPEENNSWFKIIADSSYVYSPAIGNISSTDSSQIVIANANGQCYMFHQNGESATTEGNGLLYNAQETIITYPMLINWQDNILNEIVLATNNYIYILNNNGTVLDSINSIGEIKGIAAYDFNDDTFQEIIISTSNGLYLWGRGEAIELLLDKPLSNNILIGQISANDIMEIVIAEDNKLYILNIDGEILNGFPIELANDIKSLALGDINQDGYLEIVCTCDNKIFVINYAGVILNNFPIEDDFASYSAMPLVCDINGDNKEEIIIGGTGLINILENNRAMTGKNLPWAIDYEYSLICDFDSDSQLELVVSGNDGYITIWNLETSSNTLSWNVFAGNPLHQSAYLSTITSSTPTNKSILDADKIYNYPNPVYGNSTIIRYHPGVKGIANIRIFNLAGEQIAEYEQDTSPNVDNEIEWEFGDIASGVYYCAIELNGANVIHKIAVIR